jgi:hypothetical protein
MSMWNAYRNDPIYRIFMRNALFIIGNITVNYSSIKFSQLLYLLSAKGRAIAQAVSRWLPTAAARVRAQIWSCGICGGQSGAGAGFLRVLRFLPIFIPPTGPQSPSSIIWGWYNRPEVAAVRSGFSPIPLRGFSPPANYTDRATAACWRS